MPDLPMLNRRQFLRRTGCAALGTTGLFSALGQMRLLQGAVSGPADLNGDYKALVCLFLFGGNDANNLIVPREGEDYSSYAATRGALALPRENLLAIQPTVGDGRAWGLHPVCTGLRDLFADGRLAFLANTGTLVAPITRDQYLAKSVAVPPQLFSHNDQQVYWQTSRPDSLSKTGWGGRLADLINALNENPRVSMSISLAGNNVFQVGADVYQYQIGTSGTVGLSATSGYNSPPSAPNQARLRKDAIEAMLNQPPEHFFAEEFAAITNRAVASDALIKSILAGIPERNASAYPAGSRLGMQLRMILRLIEAAPQLNLRRQIFFCSLGGWDTHDDQANDQSSLLADLSGCVKAFSDACADPVVNLSNQVTLFSASDFGRTFGINGDGTDHGWGNHHFIAGGAVQGGNIYGRMPILSINGPDDTSKGRWIPTTAVDEYAATLARWFGVSSGNLPFILPNIGRFAGSDLGFMKSV